MEYLANFHNTIEYVPGLSNVVPGPLSHMPQASTMAISKVQMDIPTKFKDYYATDRDFSKAYQVLKSLQPGPLKSKIYAAYSLVDGLLYY